MIAPSAGLKLRAVYYYTRPLKRILRARQANREARLSSKWRKLWPTSVSHFALAIEEPSLRAPLESKGSPYDSALATNLASSHLSAVQNELAVLHTAAQPDEAPLQRLWELERGSHGIMITKSFVDHFKRSWNRILV